MKLTTYTWIMAAVVFAGTLPHAVGAMFLQGQMRAIDATASCKNLSYVPISEMKRLAKRIAKNRVMTTYNSKYEWKALFTLWDKESRWDYTAKNPHSTAYGIPQILNMDEKTPMARQIDLGLKYIQARYDTPSKALAFHNRYGWY